MANMYAVVQKETKHGDAILVAVFLTKGDAENWVEVQYNGGMFCVVEFDLDWGHWIEYRKALGIY